jgi:nitrogen fixation protein FixH
MNARARKVGEFTGRHMLLAMTAFFGVVIGVNMTLATLANTSWTGLVVENGYVASQEFNEREAEARAQAALGWKSKLTIGGGVVGYSLTDASGSPIAVQSVVATFRRPAYESEDQVVRFTAGSDGRFTASQTVRDGIWAVEIDADVKGGKRYREVHRIVVANGAER